MAPGEEEGEGAKVKGRISGVSHDSPRTPNARPRLSKTPLKFHEKTSKRGKDCFCGGGK